MPIPHLEPKKNKKPNLAGTATAGTAHSSGKRPLGNAAALRKGGNGTANGKGASLHGADSNGKGSKSLKDVKGFKAKWREMWKRRWFRIVVIAIAAAIVGMFLMTAAAIAWVSRDLADITDLNNRTLTQTTKIYARDGETLLYQLGDNKRQDVPLSEMNPHIIDATLALEDRRFYQHAGFDPIGMARAGFTFLLRRDFQSAQGASTLTQQFISNAILSKERSLARKGKELVLAVRLEQKYSKDEILNMYLNEVYYGPNYQGVEAAAQEYFKKSAKDVSLSEAAILASLPKNPVNYPRNPERLKERRDYALDVMVEDGKITKEEAEEAKKIEVVALNTNITEIKAAHFVFQVIEELEQTYGQSTIRKNGFKVVTTLDWDKQQKAEKAIAEGIGKVEQYGGSNASLVSIDTKTGQLVALVGSRDYFNVEQDGQVNVATSLRQPGSSIKPLVYETAFEKGLTPDTKVWDVKTDFPSDSGTYSPNNYDGGFSGLVSLRSALPQSLNIPAVKVLYLTGLDRVIDSAQKLGYTSLNDRARYGLALTLGGAEVSLLEHTSAFATFAREGERHPVATILKIEDQNGKTVEEWEDKTEQVLDKDAVRMLNSVLSDQGLRYSPLNSYSVPGHPVAIKTGTTNDFRDAWAMGYTPSYATGIWTGNNDNSEMNRRADGSVIAAPIWFAYMRSILEGTPTENFQKASWTNMNEFIAGNAVKEEEILVDKITKERIPEECIASYPEEFKEKIKVKEAHSELYFINKDDFKNSPPTKPDADPMFGPWEKGVQEYTKDKSEYTGSTEGGERKFADCKKRSENSQPTINISSPSNGATFDEDASITITVRAKPGKDRSIDRVEIAVDGKRVKTGGDGKGEATVTTTIQAKDLRDGKHSITATVTDDIQNTATANGSFTIEEAEDEEDEDTNANNNKNSNSNGNSNGNTNDGTGGGNINDDISLNTNTNVNNGGPPGGGPPTPPDTGPDPGGGNGNTGPDPDPGGDDPPDPEPIPDPDPAPDPNGNQNTNSNTNTGGGNENTNTDPTTTSTQSGSEKKERTAP